MRTLLAFALLTTTAAAEGITLEELDQGGVLDIQTDAVPCPDWAADESNHDVQKLDTWEGPETFYWRRNWGSENRLRLYQSLDGHRLIVKTDSGTERCTLQIFKF